MIKILMTAFDAFGGDTVNAAREAVKEADVDALVAMLDQYAGAEGSRMKIDVVEGEGKVISRQYHHGRCDVGSPWAKGQAFDVLE